MRAVPIAVATVIAIGIVTAVSVSRNSRGQVALQVGPGAAAAACTVGVDCLPAIEMVDQHGHKHSPVTWAGKAVVINLWATWCAPCRKEIPAIANVARDRADKVVVLGLLQDEPSEGELLNFMSDSGLDYPVVRITPAIRAAFRVQGLPTTLIYDTQGQISQRFMGAISEEQLAYAVDRALGLK